MGQGNGHELVPFSTVETVSDPDYEYGNFGFKDENGNIVIEPKYVSCIGFSYGLCPVAIHANDYENGSNPYDDLRWGYIGETGTTVIPFRYRQASIFNKYGIAVVQDEYGENSYLINRKGKAVFRENNLDFCPCYDADDRFLEFSAGKYYDADFNIGAYDTKLRRILLEPVTDGIIEWSEDEVEVYEKGKANFEADFRQHYINSRGEELYPGLAGKGFNIVERPNASGYVIICFFQWEEISEPCGSSYFLNLKDNKKYHRIEHYGVANLQGELVIPAEYDKIMDNKDGSFLCVKEDQETKIIL